MQRTNLLSVFLLIVGSFVARADADGPCCRPHCGESHGLCAHLHQVEQLKWIPPGNWGPHLPYRGAEWYYYFRPYNVVHYSRIVSLAAEEGLVTPQLSYSTQVFDKVHRDIDLSTAASDVVLPQIQRR